MTVLQVSDDQVQLLSQQPHSSQGAGMWPRNSNPTAQPKASKQATDQPARGQHAKRSRQDAQQHKWQENGQ